MCLREEAHLQRLGLEAIEEVLHVFREDGGNGVLDV